MSVSDIDSQHGVMIHYQGKGIFIFGEAGVGKSSLALELIHHGASLIADDVVDFALQHDHLMAHCPKILFGLLHTRELGLMDIRQICGQQHWQPHTIADFAIELKQYSDSPATLTSHCSSKYILGKKLDVLTLSLNNPASLKTRIDSWLAMQKVHASDLQKMQSWQRQKMAF